MQGWTEKDVAWATQMSASRLDRMIKLVQKAQQDEQQEARRGHRECVACFYLVRPNKIVGQAFTDYVCQRCGAEEVHHNTGAPKLCSKCAAESGLCARCGGLMELPAPKAKKGGR